jgi:hypothetical protein
MHYYSAHSSKEEWSKQKYNYDVCEKYYKKNVDGKRHNKIIKFIEKIKKNDT